MNISVKQCSGSVVQEIPFNEKSLLMTNVAHRRKTIHNSSAWAFGSGELTTAYPYSLFVKIIYFS